MEALKEIKLNYDGKCMKCNRDMKKGWKGFFRVEDGAKKLYCIHCAKKINETEVKQPNEPSFLTDTLDKIASALDLQSDILARIEDNIRDILKDVSALDTKVKEAIKSKTKSK